MTDPINEAMLSWGYWLVSVVALCALASLGMRIESWILRRRRRRGIRRQVMARPPQIAREAAAARKLGRVR